MIKNIYQRALSTKIETKILTRFQVKKKIMFILALYFLREKKNIHFKISEYIFFY